ncbi:hypothetical protein CesoFtcFv8_022959 [Champsocephalus esox]|uniref:Uncharacterized protein n=1 Tax=Champsocephalus esox TaxID=159716 RepID=A0AAN8B789_9TELE|nr:hypothetical protein CesoFtcFv8_022959 [Champsocephalus esox]
MASIEDFVESPNEDLLRTYKKDQLLRVADYYGLELPKKLNRGVVGRNKGTVSGNKCFVCISGACLPTVN